MKWHIAWRVETGLDYFKISFPLSGIKGGVKSSEKIISVLIAKPEISAKGIASLVGISARAVVVEKVVEKLITKVRKDGWSH